MFMSVPRISILTTAFKATYFADCLRSAQAQSCPDFEHVICDDSPDDTIAAIVREVAGDDPRVRFVRNPGTIGGRRNYLQCFDLARGHYIKYLNDDDRLAPDCLARMSAALDAHPNVTLATSYRCLIDADGNRLPDQSFNVPLVRDDAVIGGLGLLDRMLRTQTNVVGEPTTVMFRRADLAGNTPHIMSFAGRAAPKNGDTYMWTSLLTRGDAVYFRDPLSDFRQHDAQVQRDPAFMAAAVAAWIVLRDDATAAGVYDPQRGAPWVVRPLDPQLAVRWARLDTMRQRASALAAAGDAEAAMAILDRILTEDPAYVDALDDLACLTWEGGDRERAVTYWSRALECDPDHLGATLNLGRAWLEIDEVREVMALCWRYLLRRPSTAAVQALDREAKQRHVRRVATGQLRPR